MPSWFKKLFQKGSSSKKTVKEDEESQADDGSSCLCGLMGFRDSIEIAKKKSVIDLHENQTFHMTDTPSERKHRPSEAGTIAGQEVSFQPITHASPGSKESPLELESHHKSSKYLGKEISGNFKKMIREVDEICNGLNDLVAKK